MDVLHFTAPRLLSFLAVSYKGDVPLKNRPVYSPVIDVFLAFINYIFAALSTEVASAFVTDVGTAFAV